METYPQSNRSFSSFAALKNDSFFTRTSDNCPVLGFDPV